MICKLESIRKTKGILIVDPVAAIVSRCGSKEVQSSKKRPLVMGRSLLSETAAWVPPSLPNNSQPIASSPRTFRHCENGETDTVAQFAQTYRICQQQQIQSAKRGGGRNGIMGRIAGT